MKNLLLLFLVLTAFTSCNNNDDEALTFEELSLIGNWKLIEVYNDPGNGSGTFETTTNDKTVTFNILGEVVSNQSLCSMAITDPPTNSGTYSLITRIIEVPNCINNSPLTINFELLNDGNLIISYPCIEPCQEKYVKIE